MNHTIKKGDMILFFAGDTWLSKSISYLTGSEVTHAAMVYSGDSIIEILSDGVQVNKIAVRDDESKGKKAYVMRHRPELDYGPLKRSADAYLNAVIGFFIKPACRIHMCLALCHLGHPPLLLFLFTP